MPRLGVEPTITAFERAKTVHALVRSPTVICKNSSVLNLNHLADFHESLYEYYATLGIILRFHILRNNKAMNARIREVEAVIVSLHETVRPLCIPSAEVTAAKETNLSIPN
jgi:hypothetical protein